MWTDTAAQKIRKMLQHLKLAVKRPARRAAPPARQPQPTPPNATFDFNPTLMARAEANSPGPPPTSLPSVVQLLNRDEYWNNGPAEEAVNEFIETVSDAPPGLSHEEDANVYEEFLRLEGMTALPPKVKGLCGLVDGYFVLERDLSKEKGGRFDHPCGLLIGQLLNYYRMNHFDKPPYDFSFSTFLQGLEEKDYRKIWKVEGFDEGSYKEMSRRFWQGVRMLSPQKQSRYEVSMKNNLMWWARRPDKPLDTSLNGPFFERKHNHPVSDKDEIAIWVLSKEEKLYTHAAKLYRFHHSSFTGGDVVICAGDWSVKEGRLERLSALSGHYKPTIENLKRAIGVLANRFGINANTYKVWCVNKVKSPDKMDDVPARDFLYLPLSVLEANYALAVKK